MIRKNPMKDVDNPPGQARYLRDVIRKYEAELRDEDRPIQDEEEALNLAEKFQKYYEGQKPFLDNIPRWKLKMVYYAGVSVGMKLKKTSEQRVAPYPCDNAEKRLERLKQALLGLCKYPEVPAHRILQILEQSEKSSKKTHD